MNRITPVSPQPGAILVSQVSKFVAVRLVEGNQWRVFDVDKLRMTTLEYSATSIQAFIFEDEHDKSIYGVTKNSFQVVPYGIGDTCLPQSVPSGDIVLFLNARVLPAAMAKSRPVIWNDIPLILPQNACVEPLPSSKNGGVAVALQLSVFVQNIVLQLKSMKEETSRLVRQVHITQQENAREYDLAETPEQLLLREWAPEEVKSETIIASTATLGDNFTVATKPDFTSDWHFQIRKEAFNSGSEYEVFLGKHWPDLQMKRRYQGVVVKAPMERLLSKDGGKAICERSIRVALVAHRQAELFTKALQGLGRSTELIVQPLHPLEVGGEWHIWEPFITGTWRKWIQADGLTVEHDDVICAFSHFSHIHGVTLLDVQGTKTDGGNYILSDLSVTISDFQHLFTPINGGEDAIRRFTSQHMCVPLCTQLNLPQLH